jgi:endoglucanase
VLVETLDGTFARGVIDIAGRPFITADPNALRPPKIDDLYVDLGRTADNVRASVEVGAMVTLDRPVERLGDTVLGKAFDDRIGLLALLEALRALSGPTQAELIVVATTQEEVGLRGATTAGWAAAHDVALAVDITPAIDTPGALPEDAITRLGDGVGIKVMDPSTLPNRKLSAHLRQLARQRDIPHQLEILTRGGTDAAALQRARGGAPASTLSIPTRHAHTVNEMCAISDVQATIALLTAFFEHAHEGAYGYP